MMKTITNYPLLVFALTFAVMWLAELLGTYLLRWRGELDDGAREHFGLIIAAALTLLGLIIGFSFSMATSRYDQRKNLEEAEANAIGTEYVRADFLPPADAEKTRGLLLAYVDERIRFYHVRDESQLKQIDATTGRLQEELWAAVRAPAEAKPTVLLALVVSGMNDVLNSQGYTQAAWWNRIPVAAWDLMIAIAVCCSVLVGYGARRSKVDFLHLLVLPLVVSISFFLVADIDSPRGGVIRVEPQNLVSLSQSLRPR
jgi:NADH:ubiquinone oxidoreductase subunit 6 (subunit J)